MASHFRGLAAVLLSLAVWTASVHGSASGSETCDAKDGSCPARQKGSKRRKDQKWWESEEASQFRSKNVIPIDTLSFNATVTALQNHSLLIVFFDPRSKSFQELRPLIEETADALARHEQESGQPLGYIGAVDLTVHNYLMTQEAPQSQDGWQDTDKGPFRFGRPRFLPLIILQYRNGTQQKEFTGVVKKSAIFDFLRREQVPRGEEYTTAENLRALFARMPGPFVVGCSLDGQPGANETELEIAKNATEAFNASAHYFRGEMVFAKAPEELCSTVFGAPDLAGPRMLYIRKAATESSGPGRVIRANSYSQLEVVAGKKQEKLGTWLHMQRPSVLEEITPDNSWVFLDKLAPLVIFMVDASDSHAKRKGEELFASIEDRLEVKYYQLVWADCRQFGPQFEVENRCPVVLLADSAMGDIRTSNVSIHELEAPTDLDEDSAPWNSAPTPAQRLVRWLENTSSHVREWIDNITKPESSENGTDGTNGTNGTNGTESTDDTRDDGDDDVMMNDGDDDDDDDDEKPTTEEIDDTMADSSNVSFLDEVWSLKDVLEKERNGSDATNKDIPLVWHRYWELLVHMVQIRESFQAVYGHAFDFNFSAIERVQKQSKRMRFLVSTVEEVTEVLRNKTKRNELWRNIEKKIEFDEKDLQRMVRDDASPQDLRRAAKLLRALVKGNHALRTLFRDLFTELHGRALNGTLGVPEPAVREVERRDASELSVKEFLESYARPGIPVIITGLNVTEEEPWTLDFFRERCNVTVTLSRRNPKAKRWGRLETAGELPLAEFIDTFATNATRRKWYLHDWSLPRFCPPAFGPPPYRGFTVPKYFAGDYFQRAGFEGYQHSWPSLFIGSNETQSSMHIDGGNTNFILHLLSGEKEWRFYSRRHLINLYQAPQGAHFHLDVFRPDYEKFPLARYAEQFRGIQEPGELMFMPAANPHAVRNLEDIHGVSMNYVDGSNIELSLLNNIWSLKETSNFFEAQKVELYTDGTSIPHGLLSDQQPMRFGEWKGKDWKKVKYDIHF